MRIQHNIMAMNAYRNYNTNTSALSKNLEKLSSGYKINRAGDDAAGLAISEKMRAQITGLNAAQKNVKDGISLVKTAEGAMQEIQDMLNRMDYLATQSANGTYDDPVDRANLQKEVNSLKTEINRIAESANFNGINLLDGSQAASGGGGAVAKDVTVNVVADAKPLPNGWDGTAKQGVYKLDLSQYKFTATGTCGDVAKIDIKIGGQSVATASVTIGTTGTTTVGIGSSGANVALTLAAGLTSGTVTGDVNNGATSVVTLGSGADATKYGVSINGSTITLTMLDVPTKASDLTQDMSVTISKAADSGAGTDITQGLVSGLTSNQGYTNGVKIDGDAPRIGEERLYAMGEFDLNSLNIEDGAQLKIGSKTFSFQLKSDSETAAQTGTIIDMSEYNTASMTKAELAQTAARLLSAQTTTEFEITSKNNDGKIQLTEKSGSNDWGSNVDYDTNNLQGASGAKDGNWTGLVKFTPPAGSTATGGLTLQIGDTADDFNKLQVSIGDMHVTAIGIGNVDISTQAGAQSAISAIKAAINNVSSVRGDLGATQNRLEHTANNLSVMAENIQDAESTIRDTDVAEEMMKYTKNNILIQSAQAMLAQANAVPQGVLQLLG